MANLFDRIIPRTPRPVYSTEIPLASLKRTLDRYEEDYGLVLQPDFQRNRCWTLDQKKAFIVYALRGGRDQLHLKFNSVNWDSNPQPLELVDGLQRLTALQEFMADKFAVTVPGIVRPIFAIELRLPLTLVVKVSIHNLASRKEVLQWYLDLNDGGTPHTEVEIRRVRVLLEQEIGSSAIS